jgi:uncharacterized protein YbdZ (MbtH family)
MCTERRLLCLRRKRVRQFYKVVLNHKEQYSIWLAHRENALGWRDAGKSGTKEECLAVDRHVAAWLKEDNAGPGEEITV